MRTDSDGTQLCVLTVHAHPDDEASKGAPTLAAYHDHGVKTVLVCCTGGEEGDLQNPSLREAGQPFHGLTPDEERTLMARVRPIELDRSARIIGFDEVVMLGYRDSGSIHRPTNIPSVFTKPMSTRPSVDWWRSFAAPSPTYSSRTTTINVAIRIRIM